MAGTVFLVARRYGRRSKLADAHGYGARNHLTPKKRAGEKEESEGILTAGKNEDGEARRRRRRGWRGR